MLSDNQVDEYNSGDKRVIEEDNGKRNDFDEGQVDSMTQRLTQCSQYDKDCRISPSS